MSKDSFESHSPVFSKQNQDQKLDLSQINHIRYGLLNVDEWTEKVAVIMTKKVEEFEITPENRERLQTSIENILYTLIDEVEKLMEVRTSGQFSGIKKWVAGFAIDIEELRKNVPGFSVEVLNELNKPETKENLKGYIKNRLDEFTKNTYNKDKMELLEQLLVKYGCVDKADCQSLLNESLKVKQGAISFRVGFILVLVLLIFLINILSGGILDKFQVPLLIISSLCLLLSGIITPMIELEAKIDILTFQLVGEEVIFKDQILFFQSKSITDMVGLLMKEGTIQMAFVAILIFVFSIIFPSLKLISSFIYYLNFKNLRKNMFVKFFVMKSGKWSMADVMVVALFMAYIGFNGIISSQLDSLARSTKSIQILSTNGTQLMGGFYLFLFFCISSLVLSELLTRKSPVPS